ncbi:hypothetical protein ACH5RR_003611 [Cinchona calisaya]|uniref:Spermidine hydroxycinnamoyl transferase n=1 Tax=Cinchona calisaya TaxID=153742 RepID=A0ABD3AV87_9GENT
MVIFKASHIVKPAKALPENIVSLSEFDQFMPLTLTPTIYFYRPTNQELLKDAIHILKDSLSKALVKFYPLAGRLHWTTGGRVELHCNSKGVLLIEAESELKIDDFGDFCPSPEIVSLIPSADYTITPIEELPLLLVQLTKLNCGNIISLGLAISHIVADGQSALRFLSEWTKIARGSTELDDDDDLFLDRTILQPNEHQDDLALPTLNYSDFYPLPLVIGQTNNLEERKKATTAKMLQLSKDQVEKLKKKANQHQDQHEFSRFEAISAHIWKCMSTARRLKPEQETVLYMHLNFRNRLKTPLPKGYFGNTVLVVPITAMVGDLLTNPLGYTSSKIRAAIENVTDEYVRSSIACMKKIPDVSSSRYFHTVGCTQGSFYGNPNLTITSWIGLPLYGANFGWGDEIYMGPGSVAYDGKVFIIPSHNGDGSLAVPIRLQVEHMDAFEKYFYGEI